MTRRHVLAAEPGALNTVVRDFDGDGRLDVLALTAHTMDAGDVDGDGDVDLVLGSFAQVFTRGDEGEGAAPWRRPGAPAVVILENVGGAARRRPPP